jgi:peroxiredoxin
VNHLKSQLVLAYTALTGLIALGSVVAIVAGGLDYAWLGALLTVLPFIGLYIRVVKARKITRTSRHLPILAAISLAGFGLAAWDFRQGARDDWLPLLAAGVGAIGFLLYDFWYSTFGRRVSDRLVVGQRLPDFTVEDTDGEPVASSALLGQPTLFMFYRGNWCPFCMGQVREVAEQYKALDERGVSVAFISPQPTKLTERVARIFDIPYRFLVDQDLAAARALGILHEHGVPAGPLVREYGRDTVLPTVVITDPDGIVLFTDQTDNYRVRPDPAVFFRVLAAHGY